MRTISNKIKNNLNCAGFVIYTLLSLVFYGGYIGAFIIVYSNLDESIIAEKLRLWMARHLYPLFFIIAANLIVFPFRKQLTSYLAIADSAFYRHWYSQLFILLAALLNIILFNMNIRIHLIQLILCSLAAWAIFLNGQQFLHSENISWRHPTTIGSSYISALLLGLSCIILSQIFNGLFSVPVLWFIFLLFFDLFIFIARFRYLARATQSTNRLAKRMMGSLLLYTGMRLIIGIFIPLVYAFYMIFSGQDLGGGIAAMIIIGQMIDRGQTLCTNIPDSDSEK